MITVVTKNQNNGKYRCHFGCWPSRELEVFLIEEIKPKLNRFHNPEYNHDRIKLDMKKIKQLRKAGLSYAAIAVKLGVSTMTVYRQYKREVSA